ncbi:MAG: DUF302 domain-containing protein [Deltaproteobacteria bacterium]|nr:MAG: DUF302 domain-containing protein [Deltaproteobacteria bacterium]
MTPPRYALTVDVDLPFEQAVERVTELLAAQGFGVLTTIDVAATLKKKLGVDTPPYTILGACNPGFAHQAVQAVESIGVLLPCNVVVKQLDEGRCRIFLTRVEGVFELVDADGIDAIADEVSRSMQRVADGLAG